MTRKLPKVRVTTNLEELGLIFGAALQRIEELQQALQDIDDFEIEVKVEIVKEGEQ